MPHYIDPYDITQESVIQLSLTLHQMYCMIHGAAPEEFPMDICPCLDCLWRQYQSVAPAGQAIRLGRSQLYPEDEFAPLEERDVAAGTPEVAPELPKWLDDVDLSGMDDEVKP